MQQILLNYAFPSSFIIHCSRSLLALSLSFRFCICRDVMKTHDNKNVCESLDIARLSLGKIATLVDKRLICMMYAFYLQKIL